VRGEEQAAGAEKGEKRGVSIPIATAASGARRSVQNSKGSLHGETPVSQRDEVTRMFFLKPPMPGDVGDFVSRCANPRPSREERSLTLR